MVILPPCRLNSVNNLASLDPGSIIWANARGVIGKRTVRALPCSRIIGNNANRRRILELTGICFFDAARASENDRVFIATSLFASGAESIGRRAGFGEWPGLHCSEFTSGRSGRDRPIPPVDRGRGRPSSVCSIPKKITDGGSDPAKVSSRRLPCWQATDRAEQRRDEKFA